MIKRFENFRALNESYSDGISFDKITYDRIFCYIFLDMKLLNVAVYSNEIDYISHTKEDDVISYLPKNKIHLLDPRTDKYNNKFRQEMKVGKLFKKIFQKCKDNEIERMVYLYKMYYGMNIQKLMGNFKLVKGEEIRKWYRKENIKSNCVKSCMVIEKNPISRMLSRITFRIYKNNPDKINLLIYTDENNKLMGRALVWFLDEPANSVYMDRIYTRDYKIRNLFGEYAKKNGWLSYDNPASWVEGIYKPIPKKVYIKGDYGGAFNPYMDTFHYYNKKEKYLTDLYGKREKPTVNWRYYQHVPLF